MIYKITNLSFSYDNKNNIINSSNLEIEKGELITVLGKNGSGKSTLFNLLLGLNKNYKGSILLNDKEVKTLNNKNIAKIIGFVPQNHYPTFGFTVFDFVLMGCASRIGLFSTPSKEDEEKTNDIIKKLGIEELKDRDYSTLSGGERQEVTIARALVHNPEVLIFDEPTAHLDYANQLKVLKTIKELYSLGYTIIVSTHDPNHALMLNGSTVLINNGKLEKGTTEEMITEEKLKNIYKEDIKIRYNEEFKQKICIYKI